MIIYSLQDTFHGICTTSEYPELYLKAKEQGLSLRIISDPSEESCSNLHYNKKLNQYHQS